MKFLSIFWNCLLATSLSNVKNVTSQHVDYVHNVNFYSSNSSLNTVALVSLDWLIYSVSLKSLCKPVCSCIAGLWSFFIIHIFFSAVWFMHLIPECQQCVFFMFLFIIDSPGTFLVIRLFIYKDLLFVSLPCQLFAILGIALSACKAKRLTYISSQSPPFSVPLWMSSQWRVPVHKLAP